MYKPDYVFTDLPSLGKTLRVADGIYWVRMPLPFKLDHINLWLLQDRDGWTIVDTGINTAQVKFAWESIFENYYICDSSVKKIIVTHFHPDHIGLAGWLTQRFGVPLHATITEWAFAHIQSSASLENSKDNYLSFYRAAGLDRDYDEILINRIGSYASKVSPIPQSVHRIAEGDEIDINGRIWRVIIGEGHAPEHACLYCEEQNVLISGDQILPRISPNISVGPLEPNSNPLKQFISSLDNFRAIPEETLILPSHDFPFRGLSGRLEQLLKHHQERLDETLVICTNPVSAIEIQRGLFKRKLDNHQIFFAIGEALAHAHYLLEVKKVSRKKDKQGVNRFCAL